MVEQIKTTEQFDTLLKDNSSVVVDFFATWCGPCKMVGPVVEKVSEGMPNVKFVKVDVDELGDLAMRYGIMSIPAIFGFKNGQKTAEQVGFAPEPVIKALAEKTL